MSGPQGSDPNSPWSSGQQPAGSADPTAQGWQQPAYAPQQYPQPEADPAATQYAQPAQYGQQYPAAPPTPDAYGQPTQYTPGGAQFDPAAGYPAGPAQPGSKRSAGLLIGVIGALLAIVVIAVLILGFVTPGFFVTTKIDVAKVQTGVQQILTDQTNGYNLKNVKDVKCNNGQNPTVNKGDTFSCEASIDGALKKVTVTFQDDNGTYEVGRPQG